MNCDDYISLKRKRFCHQTKKYPQSMENSTSRFLDVFCALERAGKVQKDPWYDLSYVHVSQHPIERAITVSSV